MQDFKKKLYDYEAEPPAEMWQSIQSELDVNIGKVHSIKSFPKKPKIIFYAVTAAASLLIIFLTSIYFKNGKNTDTFSASNDNVSKKTKDSRISNNKILEDIIKSSKDKNNTANVYESASSKIKKYITIAGPEGQPVKISPKVATLIESADNEYPPKPVWNKKIDKWKQIMLSTTLSPTSTNLLDIAQLSSSLDNNE